MPEEKPVHRREWPGYAILAGLVVAALLIFNATAVRDLTRDRYDLVAILAEAEDIRVGSTVRVAGIEAGRVTTIELVREGDSVHVAVHMRLEGSTRTVVRRDSDVRAVRLRAIGEPLIAVEPGSPETPAVQSGDTLRPTPRLSPRHLLEQSRTLPARLDSLMRAARRIEAMADKRADDLERLQLRVGAVTTAGADLADRLDDGSLGMLLGDPTFVLRLGALQNRLGELAVAIEAALARYAPADRDSELALALASLRERTARVSGQIDQLQRTLDGGGGIFARMAEDTAIEVAVEGVRAQIDSLRAEAASILFRMFRPW